MKFVQPNPVPKIAVVGMGYWGPKIVRNLVSLYPGALVRVCDANREMLDRIVRIHPGLPVTTDIEKVLDDAEVQAVMLALPPTMHYPISMTVLNAGKDLFVEKPAALDLARVDKMVEKAAKNKRIFMVGHIYMYHGVICAIAKFLAEGKAGEVRQIFSWRTNLNLRQKNANILWSLLPHDISIARLWLHKHPEEAFLKTEKVSHVEYEDRARVVLRYPGGAVMNICLSWVDPVKTRRICVVGEKGVFVYDEIENPSSFYFYRNTDSEPWPLDPEEAQARLIELGAPDEILKPEGPFSEPLAEEVRHFVKAIETRQPPPTSGEEALEVGRVMQAVIEAGPIVD